MARCAGGVTGSLVHLVNWHRNAALGAAASIGFITLIVFTFLDSRLIAGNSQRSMIDSAAAGCRNHIAMNCGDTCNIVVTGLPERFRVPSEASSGAALIAP